MVSFNGGSLQYYSKHNSVQIQMQDELQLEEFTVCCGNTDSNLYRTSCKCKLEYSFEHNTDMERLKLATDDNRSLQHNFKHKRMPFRMQYELQLEQFNIKV